MKAEQTDEYKSRVNEDMAKAIAAMKGKAEIAKQKKHCRLSQ